MTFGVPWDQYFTEAYYRKDVPIWEAYAPGLFGEPGADWIMLLRVLGLGLGFGIMAALLITAVTRRQR